MNLEDWTLTTAGGIAEMALNRPPRMNAQRSQTFRELQSIFDAVEADRSVRVVLLRSEGKAFSAGADLKEYAEIVKDAAAFAEFQKSGLAAYRRLSRSPLPVVVAIQGHALGGGLELALHGDILLAAENAMLGLPEPKIGLIPGGGGAAILLQELGALRAASLLLTGEPVSAGQAFSMGVVSEVVAPDRLVARAREVAGRIAANSPTAVKALKRLIAERRRGVEAAESREASLLLEVFESEDAKEGIRAFAEKRPPVFRKE